MTLEPRIHGIGEPKLDAVGTFYVCFSAIWTSILAGGMYFLYRKREMPIIRIRGLPLSFGGIIFLHLYWIAVQTGYIYGPWMSAGVEYWIMSIWVPSGIALFHASNTRFLYVAEMQKRYITTTALERRRSANKKGKTLLDRWRAKDHTTQMLILVGAGMAFQLFLTVFMFLVSRKFHDSFGIPGTEVHGDWAARKAAASKGWEWWPSVFWQCIWAWMVAPYTLWRARHLHDTLGWRLQTIGCCVASLHATPMWLIGIYVPAMAPVNKYWIPPQWIAVSIMLIEIFTIFLPCWEVLKQQSLRHETLDSIARWEARNKAGVVNGGSLDTGSTLTSGGKKTRKTKAGSVQTNTSDNSILTMEALEHTLMKNPEPLQQFSALKDFSGENIAFLRRVGEWKAKYYLPRAAGNVMSAISEKDGAPMSPTAEVDIRSSFEDALRIYVDFISSRSAEFQVNLSSPDFKNLAAVFENAARIVYGDEHSPDPATPFENPGWRVGTHSSHSHESDRSDATIMENIRFWGDIPDEFGENVFDDAEVSIKYLVLTNTWPKYVKSRRSMDCSEMSHELGNGRCIFTSEA